MSVRKTEVRQEYREITRAVVDRFFEDHNIPPHAKIRITIEPYDSVFYTLKAEWSETTSKK